MKIHKTKAVTGLASFIRNDMIPKIPDKSFRIVAEAVATMAELRPDLLDAYLQNPMLAAVLAYDEDGIDLDMAEAALTAALERHGDLELTIPGIKFFSPEDKTLKFSKDDIRRLKSYMQG